MSATAQNGRARVPRVPLATAATPDPSTERGDSQLAAAVLIVQCATEKLRRNATGQIQNRTYGYVTLDAIVAEVMPLCVEQQLLWRTFPTIDEHGQPALRYRMTHLPSGEYDEDVMPLMCAAPNPQGQGSALTYARRYALTAYLNLTVDPDDDGHAAVTPSTVIPNAQVESQAPQPTAAPAKPSKRPANAAQRTMLETRARAAGLTACKFANVVLVAAGDQEREWMNEEHAENTLARLLDRLPASLVTAVKAGIDGVA